MKIFNEDLNAKIRCVIVKDTDVGYYLYIIDLVTGQCIRDYLQDTLEIAKQQAEEMYSFTNNWKEL